MNRDDVFGAAKRDPAPTKRFKEAVQELIGKKGLTWDEAWGEARRQRPDLYKAMNAVNELPPGSELSSDGQRLTPDWPVPPAVLGALGLPIAATREQYEIFRTAEKVRTITPEMAAKILVTLTRFQQLTQGMKLETTWAALKPHFPEIWAALNKASAPEVAKEAANEAGSRMEICMALGPNVPFNR